MEKVQRRMKKIIDGLGNTYMIETYKIYLFIYLITVIN